MQKKIIINNNGIKLKIKNGYFIHVVKDHLGKHYSIYKSNCCFYSTIDEKILEEIKLKAILKSTNFIRISESEEISYFKLELR